MNTLKDIISTKFANEIKFAQQYKNSVFSSKDSFLENIDIICDVIDNKTPITDAYENAVKRTIFDNASPSSSLKLVWFVCAYEDNLDLFKWACDGLWWLKGAEKNMAIDSLKEHIKEYKPQQITQWLIGKTHEDKDIRSVSLNLSPYLLYAVEHKEKKLQHQLVGRDIFITNSIETYEFLKQTQDEHLFNKIMKKHFQAFKFYKNNIILKKSDADKETKFFAHYFDENNPADITEKIKNFREMKFDNIADYISSYTVNKTLEKSLGSKDSPKRKIKI